jgi:hypothetical protein
VCYLTDLHNALVPFQAWLLEDIGLHNMLGEYVWRSTEIEQIGQFLLGEQYPSERQADDAGLTDYAGATAMPERRLDLLRQEAGR